MIIQLSEPIRKDPAIDPKTITVIALEDLAGKPFASGTDTHEVDLMAGQ